MPATTHLLSRTCTFTRSKNTRGTGRASLTVKLVTLLAGLGRKLERSSQKVTQKFKLVTGTGRSGKT